VGFLHQRHQAGDDGFAGLGPLDGAQLGGGDGDDAHEDCSLVRSIRRLLPPPAEDFIGYFAGYVQSALPVTIR
jgi:hypothetical protein